MHLDHATPGPERYTASATLPDGRRRALRVGLGGPVGSGKTASVAALCRALRDRFSLAVVTNDIYTREDAAFLLREAVLPPERITAVETGACPHTAIRDDISANLEAVEDLEDEVGPLDLVLVESGGDNLTATFSRGLVDVQIFVIDVAGGDDIPRKGGPGVTTADLLVVNKTDLAPYVGSDLAGMGPGRRAAARCAARALPVAAHRARCAAAGGLGARAVRGLDGGGTGVRRGLGMTVAASATAARSGSAASVSARARITAAPDGRGGTALPLLAGAGPIAPRRTRSADPAAARVTLVGAMSAPLNGDRLALEVRAEAGGRAAGGRQRRHAGALPGRTTGRARPLRRPAPGGGGGPTPLAARAVGLRTRQRAAPAPAGRSGAGRTAGAAGRTGTGPSGGGARTARQPSHRAVRRTPVVRPGAGSGAGSSGLGRRRRPGRTPGGGPTPAGGHGEDGRRAAASGLESGGESAVVTPLAGPALLVTAVARDALRLRRVLDSALTFTSW